MARGSEATRAVSTPSEDDPGTASTERAASRASSRTSTISLRRRLARTLGIAGAVWLVLASIAVTAFAVSRSERSRLLDRVDPADLATQQLLTDLINQETGVRGYALSHNLVFLEPYKQGAADYPRTRASLVSDLQDSKPLMALLGQLDGAVGDWHRVVATPTIDATEHNGSEVPTPVLLQGKSYFDTIRATFTALHNYIDQLRAAALSRSTHATDALYGAVALLIIGFSTVATLVWVALQTMVLGPLAAVSGDTRRVADGELDHPVAAVGPGEIHQLSEDVEAMRMHLVDNLRSLEEIQDDLSRSNRDLEQFAYVASHDLQEPLRKVASFCQLLQDRYNDQLDDRAKQYIYYAVDGARRMQVLVNDLLSFSRVGRDRSRFGPVALGEALVRAQSNLEARLESDGGEVIAPDDLPTVTGDLTLLTALWQNLLNNSLKFRAEAPPVVVVTWQPMETGDTPVFEFRVTDNGIGIEPEFAERVFVIFQRLHGREEYPGTGIGLALCRRIVEFHGGRIWVEPHPAGERGTTVAFTLPAPAPSSTDPNEETPLG